MTDGDILQKIDCRVRIAYFYAKFKNEENM